MDNVNNPSHYNKGKIECIDAIEVAVSDLSGIEAVCTANVIKYMWRWKQKNGIEDLSKARWYLSRLIKEMQKYDIAVETDQINPISPIATLKQVATLKQDCITKVLEGLQNAKNIHS